MKPLTDTGKLKLAREVLDRLYQHTDTWRENNLGSDAAYLILAILDQEHNFVDWSPQNSDCERTLATFKELFPESHPVWLFIVTEDTQAGDTEPDKPPMQYTPTMTPKAIIDTPLRTHKINQAVEAFDAITDYRYDRLDLHQLTDERFAERYAQHPSDAKHSIALALLIAQLPAAK